MSRWNGTGYWTFVKGSHSTGMLSITSKFSVGKRVQHPCEGKENGGGFSPEYVLLSFQNLTPPSCKLSDRLPELNKGHAYPMYADWGKFSLWRRLAGDRPSQERRDEPEYPNPRLAFKWPHPCSLPIEWGRRGCPPNVNLRPWVILDT